jgi:hypothetical protein
VGRQIGALTSEFRAVSILSHSENALTNEPIGLIGIHVPVLVQEPSESEIRKARGSEIEAHNLLNDREFVLFNFAKWVDQKHTGEVTI